MNLEGRLLGNRYELLEQIGNGGMATVYKAKCHVLNRNVAVKILKDEFTTDEEFIKRFNTEAQAVACFTHPNIVSVYDVGTEGNLHYIVMELIQGKTLKEIIKEDGALSWKWSVNVAIQIASALEIAHKNGIVHRDIKPHNIIITEDGIAKVTDFGIAKSVSNSTITAFGTTIGSVHYFSPEHARGGFTDAKSDLYSLGVVLYEMVTGRVPFDADTPVSVALKHMQEEPVAPRKLNKSVPLAVNNIILKAMQKDANLRYQNATEMLNDLSKALKNPNDPIVVMDLDETGEFPTQRVSIMNDDVMEARRSRTARRREEETKKNETVVSKIFGFIGRHKIISSIVGLILLFILSLTLTTKILGKKKVKDVQIVNLVGITKEEAKQKAEEAGFVFEVAEEKYDADVEEGKIISQTPAYQANYTIKEKSKISVVVSLGQQMTKVPKVKGEKKEDAIKKLEEALLEYEIEEKPDKKVEEGVVIDQDTEPDEEVAAGTKIKLTVSTGVKKVTVTKVQGMKEEKAIKALEDLGLEVEVFEKVDPSAEEEDVVIDQSIDPGEEVEEGTQITIKVVRVPKEKEATVTVDLKSIVGDAGTVVDEVTGTETAKKFKVEILVDGDSKYSNEEATINDKISKTFTRTGKVKISVKINGNERYNEYLSIDDDSITVNKSNVK